MIDQLPKAVEGRLETPTTSTTANRWPVRLWPALVILVVGALMWVIPPKVAPRTMFHFFGFFMAPILGTLAAIIWWVFASRVRGRYRWLVPTLVVVPIVPLALTLHKGNGMPLMIFGLAAALFVWIGWLALSVPFPRKFRQVGLITALAALWVVVALLRLDGTDADIMPNLLWRWQQTAEEKYLAGRSAPANPSEGVPSIKTESGDWPEFRGSKRDGLVLGAKLDPDWNAHHPELVWKHLIGPGWGSFAIAGGKLFTQEQVGNEEAVVCYDAATGSAVWEYKYPARFSESIAGPGPRATPTIHDGKVFAQGATGKLVRLDAGSGKHEWTADVVEAGGILPQWGFAASPLVTDGMVIVYAGGGTGKGTAAFKADTGELAWVAGNAKHGYSSAHPANFGGEPQVLMLSDYGLESFRAVDGAKLWEHVWPVANGQRSTQPMVLSDTEVVIGTGVGSDQGVRRLKITKNKYEWEVKTIWSTRGLKPYFNDAVVVDGHIYGFDDDRFCCVDLENGKQKWKETGYGHGQVIGIPEQGLLLVQTVSGPVVLVRADPNELNELAKLPVLKEKTWNHPVVAHGFLFVRNGEEAVCYRLPTK